MFKYSLSFFILLNFSFVYSQIDNYNQLNVPKESVLQIKKLNLDLNKPQPTKFERFKEILKKYKNEIALGAFLIAAITYVSLAKPYLSKEELLELRKKSLNARKLRLETGLNLFEDLENKGIKEIEDLKAQVAINANKELEAKIIRATDTLNEIKNRIQSDKQELRQTSEQIFEIEKDTK